MFSRRSVGQEEVRCVSCLPEGRDEIMMGDFVAPDSRRFVSLSITEAQMLLSWPGCVDGAMGSASGDIVQFNMSKSDTISVEE